MMIPEEVKAHREEIIEIEHQQDFCKFCQGIEHCRQDIRGYKLIIRDDDWRFRTAVAPCRYERQRMQNVKQERYFKTAHVPARYARATFSNYQVTNSNKIAVSAARWIVTGTLKDNDKNGLMFYGPRGTGKTMLVAIIANEKARRGESVLFLSVPDLLNALRDSYGTNTNAKAMQFARETPCLILDDLGAERMTEWVGEQLFSLLNYRYNEKKQTIITTNYSRAELAKRLSFIDKQGGQDDTQAQRILSRISGMCESVYLGGKDWRMDGGATA